MQCKRRSLPKSRLHFPPPESTMVLLYISRNIMWTYKHPSILQKEHTIYNTFFFTMSLHKHSTYRVPYSLLPGFITFHSKTASWLFQQGPVNDLIAARSYWERERKIGWKTTVKWEGTGETSSPEGGSAWFPGKSQRERKPSQRIEVKTEEALNTLCKSGSKKKWGCESPPQAPWGENSPSHILFPDDFIIVNAHALPSFANPIIIKKRYPTQKKTNMLLFIHAGRPTGHNRQQHQP